MSEELNFKGWDGFFDQIRFTLYRTAHIQAKYIEEINSRAKLLESPRLLEIAAGSGYTSAIVADLLWETNPLVTVSDVSEDLMGRVAQTHIGAVPGIEPVVASAYQLPFPDGAFDISYHQGFFEHFQDEEVRALVREQARVSRYCIADIPNGRRWNKTQEFGNERFLPHKDWVDLIKSAGVNVVYDTGRRFTNKWKTLVPVALHETNWFHRNFGESSIIIFSAVESK